MSTVPFPAPEFTGHPVVLLGHLRPLGIVEKQLEHFAPTVDHLDEQGRLVREVGDVTVTANGRITAWPRSNVCDRGRIIVLRCAENAFTNGTDDGGWASRTTASGATYRRCTVLAYLEPGGDTAATVEETIRIRSEELLTEQLSRIELADQPGGDR